MRGVRIGRWGLVLLSVAFVAGCSSDEGDPGGEPDAVAEVGDPGDTEPSDTDTGQDQGGETDAGPGDVAPDAADVGPSPEQAMILGVGETTRRALPGLSAEVHVLRTEGNRAHIYAANRRDAAMVQGFISASERFFMLDMARRLGTGTLSLLMGDAALEIDLEQRLFGSAHVAQRSSERITEPLRELMQAFADGANAYRDLVIAGEMPQPPEHELAAALLGKPIDEVMTPMTADDVALGMSVFIYESSWETGDVGYAREVAKLEGLFEGQTEAELRHAGVVGDIYEEYRPPWMHASAQQGFSIDGGDTIPAGISTAPGPAHAKTFEPLARAVNADMLDRLVGRLEAVEERFVRDKVAGFGSNAWAASGAVTPDGGAIIAADPHLALSIPSYFYPIAFDTEVFSDGTTEPITMTGVALPFTPFLTMGTNGSIAWHGTQHMADITDWYREEIQLDAEGWPARSWFQDEWHDLVRVDEVFEIADVPLLDSVGRTETWPRFETFDGKWITDMEGRVVTDAEPAQPGEQVLNFGGTLIAPQDMDGDGVITAIAADYAGYDIDGIPEAFNKVETAKSVLDWREASRGMIATSLNWVVADVHGDVYYSGYHAVPCRGYLAREADGRWAEGSDPNLLLDGTVYGGFEIPRKDQVVDEGPGQEDPYKCVVPFETYPAALSPERGYVMTANNDPGGLSFDSQLYNDDWYIGGPWDRGARAFLISSELEAAIDDGGIDREVMKRIQDNHQSPTPMLLLERFLGALDAARAADSGSAEPHEQRLAALYAADAARIDEAQERLEGWAARGYEAASGVATFYHELGPDEVDDAVATTIWNVWLPRAIQAMFNDEGIPGVWHRGNGSFTAFARVLIGAPEPDTSTLASLNPATGETIFCDRLDTDELERCDEILVESLLAGLDFAASEPTEPGKGGWGTSDMSEWLWGLRHVVKFRSLISDFLGDDPAFSFIGEQFSITTEVLPLGAEPGSPASKLTWFPRPGDNYGVDAANPGFSGTDFSYGSGPVQRMLIHLTPDRVEGHNVIPGGQDADPESDFFADQAALWLGNQTNPLRHEVDLVVEGATGREVFEPAE